MPGLVFLGRRWEVASDDLVFPSIIESLIRIIWYLLSFLFLNHQNLFNFCQRFITIIVIWSCHSPYLDCEDGEMLQMYLGGVVSVLLVITVANAILVNQSMKGSIMDIRARKLVPIILYIRYVHHNAAESFVIHFNHFQRIFQSGIGSSGAGVDNHWLLLGLWSSNNMHTARNYLTCRAGTDHLQLGALILISRWNTDRI